MIADSATIIPTMFIAAAIVTAWFSLTYNIDLNLSDEGYLWYGTQRTVAGEIPIRDFRAYGPGRYYWCALWSLVFGRRIFAIRFGAAIFQFFGITLGLLAVQNVVQNFWWVSIIGIVFVLWMLPWYKVFEPCWALASIFVGLGLIENPEYRNFLFTGVFVGLSLFMGVNHGLYNGLAFSFLVVLILLKLDTGLVTWHSSLFVLGIVIGAIPTFAMFMLIPNLAKSYLKSQVLVRLKRGTANLQLKIPWPWRPVPYQFRWYTKPGQFFIRLFFVLFPACFISVITWALVARLSVVQANALAVASACTGVFYMHHAFSRADISHLSQCIHPLLICLIAVFYQQPLGWGVLVVLLGTGTLWGIVLPQNPYLRRRQMKNAYIRYTMGEDTLWLEKKLAATLDAIRKIVKDRVATDETFFAVPVLVGLYAIFGKKAPMFDTFPVYPATRDAQHDMLASLKANPVTLALIHDFALDGRDDLRFRNTHPIVWNYVANEFTKLNVVGLPDDYHLFCRDFNTFFIQSLQ